MTASSSPDSRDKNTPCFVFKAALLRGTARRVFRSDEAAPLMPIHSIRFFLPIIDELKYAHLDNSYLNYLAHKLSDFLAAPVPSIYSSARPNLIGLRSTGTMPA